MTAEEKFTKAYMDFVRNESNNANKKIKKKMLDTASLLGSLFLWRPSNSGYSFTFKDSVSKRLFKELSEDIKEIVDVAIYNSIELSRIKNEKIFLEVVKTPEFRNWLNRRIESRTLSQRIWKYTENYKYELESRIATSIVNKDSEVTFIKNVTKYLEHPFDGLEFDKSFLWKANRLKKDFNPGRGVYKSAYANAKRLVRTETFSAYRKADYIIWNKSKRVSGIIISLNIAHSKTDICDDLVGVYPKKYLFLGFHSACICLSRPILDGKMVESVPKHAKEYMKNKKMRKWYGKLSFYNDNKSFWN